MKISELSKEAAAKLMREEFQKLPWITKDTFKVGDKIVDRKGVAYIILSISPKGTKIMVDVLDKKGKATNKPEKLNTHKYHTSGIGSGRSELVEPKFKIITDRILKLAVKAAL